MRTIPTAPSVRITYADAWRVRALVREGRLISKVVYEGGHWRCECEQPDCRHIRATKSVTRTV